MSTKPPFAVVVTHTVRDFDTWKRAFDAHQPAREAAGFLGHHVNRGVDDPNRVSVYLPAVDRKRAEAFLASDSLKMAMGEAGVTNKPEISLLTPVEDQHVSERPTAAILLSHRVADFGAWKRVYDSVDSARRNQGIIGHSVNQIADDPTSVLVYHQAETNAELERFVASPTLEDAMQKAGVTSKPEITFVSASVGVAY